MFIKSYFKNLKDSLVSTNYYVDSLKKPFINTFTFFIVTIAILGIINGAYTAFVELPKTITYAQQVLDDIQNHFPEDLIFNWDGTNITTNREQLAVSYPKNFNPEEYGLPTILAVFINESKQPSDLNFEEDQLPLVIFARNNMFINSTNDQDWNEYPLDLVFSEVKNLQVTKETIDPIITDTKNTITDNANNFQVFVSGLAAVLYITSTLWFVLVESFLVYLLVKLYSIKLKYQQVLILTLNIAIPASILTMLGQLLYPTSSFPMRTITFWVILFMILISIKNNKEFNVPKRKS